MVAATQATLANAVNLSAQTQQMVRFEAFQQLIAHMVSQLPQGQVTLPQNWPAEGVSPAMQRMVTALLLQATAGQPLPQQLVSLQMWPAALTQAVLQQAQPPITEEAPTPPPPSAPMPQTPTGTPVASVRTPLSLQLPLLQNWLVQQGTLQGADGERAFTLTLRVPAAWAQAQSVMSAALPGPSAAPAASASPAAALLSATPAAGQLQLPIPGSVQALQSATLALVMQPAAPAGSAYAAAAQAMRTSALLQLEFQPLVQAQQAAPTQALLASAHLQPADVQALLQNRGTDPWLLMAQAQADGQHKQAKSSPDKPGMCNHAGCQYYGRASCAQPFCAEMNALWSVDRSQRRR